MPLKHENDHESILNRAFAVKYNPKKMKKLEKEFSILKKEEQEEQVEIRRLRAENKLLKQRIDNLEKVSNFFYIALFLLIIITLTFQITNFMFQSYFFNITFDQLLGIL